MNYLEFHRHIKNQEMLPVYLVTGEEHFLRNIVVSLLKSKIIKSDDALTFDFEQFSFPEIDFNLFKQTYYSPSIFSEKKMVVISAAQIGGSAKKSKGDQEILKKLLAIISKPNPSSCLMIVADKVDARTALYKRIKPGAWCF